MTPFRNLRLSIILLAGLAFAGCNTVQGLGQDIESVGRKGEEVINQ